MGLVCRCCQLEHRWLTAVFIDVVWFTELAERLEAEALIYFGDEEMHRASVALGCIELVAALPALLRARSERWHADGHLVRLSVRAGIASGYCSLGDWGRERLDFTIVGAPVNLSQRVQTHAAAGGALMCAATAALVGQGAPGHVGASSKFQLKGLGEVVGHPLVDLPIRSANVPARSAYRAAERRKKVDQVG